MAIIIFLVLSLTIAALAPWLGADSRPTSAVAPPNTYPALASDPARTQITSNVG
jgi:hypothetical protein